MREEDSTGRGTRKLYRPLLLRRRLTGESASRDCGDAQFIENKDKVNIINLLLLLLLLLLRHIS